MIISIDSGNRNIKTENFVFPSSLAISDYDMGFGTDIMKYNGKYYSLDGKRIKYMRDKTSDERFFILALFGIAKEIEYRISQGHPERASYTITLLNGMPPKHLANSDRFRDYFLTEKPVTFTYNNKEYKINIKEVYIFPQAYAIAGLMKKRVASEDQLLIVDIGGWTLDYMVLNNGRYSIEECQSLEYGMIKLYNDIQNYCNSTFDINLREKDIDNILNGTCKLKLDNGVKEYVFAAAERFCNEIVNTLREQLEGFRTMPIIFAGGGSVTLEKFFKKNPMLVNATYIDDVKANARGYKALYKIFK